MSRALCIPFHRYHPHTTEHYRVWMQSLLSGLSIWGGEFDKLYLIDDYWDFNFEELDRLNKLGIEYEIIKKQRDGHHWVQYHTALPHIEEDYCLFLDNDVVIWKEGIVDKWFKQAESGKFVTALDGSGGLKDKMNEKFPALKGSSRMGSYYFILNKQQRIIAHDTDLAPINYKTGTHLKELNYITKEGDWQDSFGLFTAVILTQQPDIWQIDDDRSSIYLDGLHIIRDPKEPKRLGYYHVRNGSNTSYLMCTKYGEDLAGYKHSVEIVPQKELLRIMAWHNYVEGGIHEKEIRGILCDIGVSWLIWEGYLENFVDYHGL